MNPERNGPFKPLFNSLSLASQARPGIAEASIFRGLMSLTSSWGRKHRLNCTSPVWNGVPGIITGR
jgi:hypothetical protein